MHAALRLPKHRTAPSPLALAVALQNGTTMIPVPCMSCAIHVVHVTGEGAGSPAGSVLRDTSILTGRRRQEIHMRLRKLGKQVGQGIGPAHPVSERGVKASACTCAHPGPGPLHPMHPCPAAIGAGMPGPCRGAPYG